MADRKFLVNIDLDQNSLISAVIENRDSVVDGYPSTPVAGQIFYDENASNKKPFYYDGTTWVAMSSATASSVPFSGVTAGTNTTATMTVGTGASLTVSGSGTINANNYNSNAIIALADGGTNANLTAVNGGILYSTSSALAISSAGSSGQLLQSGGAGAPTWISVASLSIDHGALTGLSDDDHTQYITTSPASDTRNIIQASTATTTCLIIREASGSSAHALFSIQNSSNVNLFVFYRLTATDYRFYINSNAGTFNTSNTPYIKAESHTGVSAAFINVSSSSSFSGGAINTSGGASAAGGSLITNNGGGSIDTTGNGSIQFGIAANRITIQGVSGAAGKTLTLPNLTGTVIGAASTSTTDTHIAMATATAGGIKFVALSGDATISNTGSLTVSNNAITLAKFQQIATASILGRSTAGTGDIEVLSASTVRTLLSINNVENTALSTWTGSTNLTTLGTITTGTWNGNVISPAYGGTGVSNNAASTLTISGNFASTFTITGITSVTLPTSGTLATLAGSESLTNKKLGSLTSNGFVKTSGGDGTLSVDTNTYLTANQTITLSGDVTGSGTTAISTTIANNAVTLAKFQQIATASILGRSTASTGNVEVIAVQAPLTISGGNFDFDETAALGNNARVAVSKNSGATVGTRRRINFLEGTNITLTISDDSGNEEVDVTIAASGVVAAYTEVQEEGTPLTARSKLNFVGSAATASDDAGNTRTNITFDAGLNALATYNTDGFLVQTANDTFVGRTLSAGSSKVSITNGSGVSGNPSIDVVEGNITHNNLGGLTTGDPHTQYVYLSPNDASRNVISMQGSSGTVGLGITGLTSPSGVSNFFEIKHGTAGTANVLVITEASTDTSYFTIGSTVGGNSNLVTAYATFSIVGPVTIAPTTSATTVGLTVRQTSTTYSTAHNVFTVQTNGGTDIVNVWRSAASAYVLRLNTNAASGGTVGYIQMNSVSGRVTGFINTSAGASADGGSINTSGALGGGGNISTFGSASGNGGSILTNAGSTSGGSINTSDGGGSINTTGNGSIQFGIAANRITVQGTASSGGRVYTLPNVGADTFFVMSAGTQSITGAKTFSGSSLLLGGAGAGVATFTYANSANSRTITFPDAGGNKSVCIATESTSTTHALFASATTGQPAFRAIVSGDLPSLTGTYVRIVPTSSSDNIIAPNAVDVVPLTVRTTGGAFSAAHNVFTVQNSGGTDILNVYRSASNTYVLRLNTNGTLGGTVGYIQMNSFSGRTTGFINTSATSTANGGSISLGGGTATNTPSGYINLSGGSVNNAIGGNLDLRGFQARGGNIYAQGSVISSTAASGSLNMSASGSLAGGNIYTFSGGDDADIGGIGGNIYVQGGSGGTTGILVPGGAGGDIFAWGGDGGSNDSCPGGAGGHIWTYGGSGDLSGFSTDSAGGNGGSIETHGANGVSFLVPGGNGGDIKTHAYESLAGGSLLSNAGSLGAGGSLDLSDGGGSIVTNGNASYIQFGRSSVGRVTLRKTGTSTDSIVTIPQPGGSSYNMVIASGSQSANNFAVANSSTLGDVVFRNILSSDIPSLTGTYLRVVPAATSDNTVAPTASGVVGLVVKQTTTSPAKIFEVQTSGGSPIFTVGDSGGNTDVTVATNLTVTGNLTINGTTTTVNTSTLLVEDNFITVNSLSAVLDAGIEVERASGGTGDNAFIRFKETVDQQWYIDNGTYEWIVARRYSGTITGNGSSTAFNITHNMNSKNVAVQVYDSSDILVYPEISTPNANYATITFKPAPGGGVQYRVVVVG